MASEFENKLAEKRARQEVSVLTEVNCYVNHNPQERVTAGMRHSKTLHHGVDLRSVLAKYDRLCAKYGFHPARFVFGIAEGNVPQRYGDDGNTAAGGGDRHAVLLVDMPDVWRVLSDDDFVHKLAEYPYKVLETAEKLALWTKVDAPG